MWGMGCDVRAVTAETSVANPVESVSGGRWYDLSCQLGGPLTTIILGISCRKVTMNILYFMAQPIEHADLRNIICLDLREESVEFYR